MVAYDTVAQKRLAAAAAVDYIEDGMVLGLGSGSTSAIALELIGQKVAQGLRVTGVPTSLFTERRARELGIPLVADPEEITLVNLTIDGADEVDENCNLIKGGGGASTREKIIASISERVIIMVDSTKVKTKLGAFPVPVEVLQFGWRAAAQALEQLGASEARRRLVDGKPHITENGNFILDCPFTEFPEVGRLAQVINTIPAVVENGVFYGLCDLILVGQPDGTVREIFA